MIASVAALKIEMVLAVEDTRQYEEVGDRWVPIPGSGKENSCFRCGRAHEVHATVRLSDGSQAVVGVSCAKAEDAEVTKRLVSAAGTAKRLKRLEAELEARRALLARWDAVRAEVARLPHPEMVTAQKPGTYGPRHELRMGDAVVWSTDGVTRERVECLTEAWRDRRMIERGFAYGFRPWFDEVGLERRIAKLRARLGPTGS